MLRDSARDRIGTGPWYNSKGQPISDTQSELHGDTLLEAQVLIEAWRNEYNRFRPHSSLGYRSPAPEVVAGAPLLRDETLTLQVV